MRKNFRNRLIAVSAAATMSFLLLSGFDSSLTVQDVSQNMTKALQEAGGVYAEVKGTADLSIDASVAGQTQSIPVKGDVSFTVAMLPDPFIAYVTGTATGDASAFGLAGGTSFEAYLEGQVDGTGIVYVYMAEGGISGWHAAQVPADQMSQITASVNAAFGGDTAQASSSLGIDLDALKEKVIGNAALAPEAVNVNGIDCYEITQTIDGSTLVEVISEIAGKVNVAGVDTSSLEAASMLLGGLKLDYVYDCNVETFYPVYTKLDLAGSDFSTIAQMFGAMMGGGADPSQTPEMSIAVDALNLEMNFDEAPAGIEIPKEARDATVESISVPDVAGIAGAAE